MRSGSPVKIKVYARAVTAILLIITWSLVILSGIILYLAPSGFRAGKQELWLGLTKSAWDDIHFWIGVVTVAVVVVHVIIDWKAMCGVIRYLTSTHRGTLAGSEK
jgi:cytochrome b561